MLWTAGWFSLSMRQILGVCLPFPLVTSSKASASRILQFFPCEMVFGDYPLGQQCLDLEVSCLKWSSEVNTVLCYVLNMECFISHYLWSAEVTQSHMNMGKVGICFRRFMLEALVQFLSPKMLELKFVFQFLFFIFLHFVLQAGLIPISADAHGFLMIWEK